MYESTVRRCLTLGAALIFAASLVQSDSSRASASVEGTQPSTCSLNQLSVTVPSASAAGGAEGMLIAFRNSGATTCDLQGYPKVVATRPGASFHRDCLYEHVSGWPESRCTAAAGHPQAG